MVAAGVADAVGVERQIGPRVGQDAGAAPFHEANSSRKMRAVTKLNRNLLWLLGSSVRSSMGRWRRGARCRRSGCRTGAPAHGVRARIQVVEQGRVEADLARIVDHRVGNETAHGVAQHGLGAAVAHEMAGRDLLAPVEQIGVEVGRAVLDREVHGVEIVVVEDDRDALVKQLVGHAVAQQGRGVDTLSERLAHGRTSMADEALGVEIDVIARERPADEVVGILQKRIAHDRRDVRATPPARSRAAPDRSRPSPPDRRCGGRNSR